MASLVERMLQIADGLIADRPRSAAARRRAVSTAYYAAFHAFARVCTDELVREADIGSTVYTRAYRALTHGAFQTARGQLSQLTGTTRLREALDLMHSLRQAREVADYACPDPDAMKLSAAREHLDQAHEIVERLDRLTASEREFLAVFLLVKDSRERGRG